MVVRVDRLEEVMIWEGSISENWRELVSTKIWRRARKGRWEEIQKEWRSRGEKEVSDEKRREGECLGRRETCWTNIFLLVLLIIVVLHLLVIILLLVVLLLLSSSGSLW